MSGLRLGIDLDGVVADFNAGWTWRYNRDFPGRMQRELRADDVVVWDAPTLLTHFAGMGEFWEWVRTCAEGRSLFYGLDPYPGAIDALNRLRAEGHDLVILTTKPDFSVGDTHDWLALHEVPSVEVHILYDKTAVDCDMYLDDADHNLRALASSHPGATVCRYVRPWNSPVPGVVDVTDWESFATTVEAHRKRGD